MNIVVVDNSDYRINMVEQIRKLNNLIVSDIHDQPEETTFTIKRSPVDLVPKFYPKKADKRVERENTMKNLNKLKRKNRK